MRLTSYDRGISFVPSSFFRTNSVTGSFTQCIRRGFLGGFSFSLSSFRASVTHFFMIWACGLFLYLLFKYLHDPIHHAAMS
jgi:hypothetical protein